MCGRYAIAPERADAWASIANTLGKHVERLLFELENRYNVAPTDLIPVIIQDAGTRQVTAVLARWGFVPDWWKEPRPPKFSTINARSEDAEHKPLWREAFRLARCLVPATHWYEWQLSSSGNQPHALTSTDGRGFMFAGLYSRRTDPQTGEPTYTASILTRNAAGLARQIHERMPVILHPKVWTRWLEPALQDAAQVSTMLEQNAVLEARAWPVSRLVNAPKNQGAELLNPV